MTSDHTDSRRSDDAQKHDSSQDVTRAISGASVPEFLRQATQRINTRDQDTSAKKNSSPDAPLQAVPDATAADTAGDVVPEVQPDGDGWERSDGDEADDETDFDELADTAALPTIDDESVEPTEAMPVVEASKAERAATAEHPSDADREANFVVRASGHQNFSFDSSDAGDQSDGAPLDGVDDLGDAGGLDDTDVLGDTSDLEDAFEAQDTSELPFIDEEAKSDGGVSEDDFEREEADASEDDEDDPTTELPAMLDTGSTDEVVSAASLEKEARHQHRVRRRIVVGVVAAALLACYAGGAVFFYDRLFPNTTVNGMDASLLSADQLQSLAEQQATLYSTTVSGSGFSLSVGSQDVGYTCDGAALAADALAQQSELTWPVAVFQDHEVSVNSHTSYDDAALTQAVSAAVQSFNDQNMNSSYAYVGYDYDTNEYRVMGKVSGNAVSEQDVHDTLAQAVQDGATAAELDSSAVREATLTDCLELAQVADIANRDRSASIDITVNGETKYTLDDSLKSWISVSGSKVVVSESALRVWAKYTLAPKLAYTSDDNDYTLDVDTFVNTLVTNLQQGVTDPIEAPMTETRSTEGLSKDAAYSKGGWDSSKGRYVDVDLGAQYARMYDSDGTLLWESAFVSGDVGEGRSTPTGTYHLNSYKTTNTTLIGADEDLDGDPDYESHVDYWLPFIGNAYAFHDASWRSHFGGDIYKTNGSHGCVNLPHDKAESLYQTAQVGDTVYVHA